MKSEESTLNDWAEQVKQKEKRSKKISKGRKIPSKYRDDEDKSTRREAKRKLWAY